MYSKYFVPHLEELELCMHEVDHVAPEKIILIPGEMSSSLSKSATLVVIWLRQHVCTIAHPSCPKHICYTPTHILHLKGFSYYTIDVVCFAFPRRL